MAGESADGDPNFAISTTSALGRTVVAVSGDLDVATVEQLRAVLTDAVVTGDAEVDVDMSEVTFVDSSGLGCLIGCYIKLDATGRRLRIVQPSLCVRRLLAATGQLDRFTAATDGVTP